MINQEFLSQCSDDQINKGVAWLEAVKSEAKTFRHYYDIGLYKRVDKMLSPFAPCVWPNDIMPIAFANGIGMYAHTKNKIDLKVTDIWAGRVEYYSSLGQYRSAYSKNTNPLRAICEVYILMMVAK